ncbi:hypothetical protein M9H77_28419 [Catharanthus roseus]|uniref:Uncharacterized protein n=1 Tax=Catharanthus roseus TaxID=4058 RepID=A0ACC0AJF0_CATRO|nr:hypothetical protein M9H77_28419 [Catharanthus roseus]
MSIEAVEVAGLVGPRKDFIGQVNEKVIKKKRYRRKMIRKSIQISPILALQRLFLSCQEVFKGHGTVPSPNDVQKLCHILDAMMPEDVGLSGDLQFFKPRQVIERNARVTYATIYKCDNFSLCILFLPASTVIPLHNHPGMTVFSKLLLGTMHIKSYDWVDPVDSNDQTLTPKMRLARMKANDIFRAPCNTSVLYPTSGGNIHEFRAITPCAVLDVLGPPYSKEDGRDCSYYKDTPYKTLLKEELSGVVKEEEDSSYGWLEEIEMPEESEMDVIKYLGPKVADAA